MLTLGVITASTRPERKGDTVAGWFVEQARAHEGFTVDAIDLAEVGLPLFNEPRHPRLQQYEHEHTRRWGARVGALDAVVFVTPEYNYGTPPSLSNALDFVTLEWGYKPAGFVSYGGVSGGTRGVQMTKQIVTALKMMPIPEAVAIPFFSKYIDDDTGRFDPGEVQAKAASKMLGELRRWAEALKPMRQA